ncbi:hypothetical protein BWI17_10800 [Betaproteobacteria bacterium GR16-43]|nr:hypothetical protein BWI17_10800 [Betaproteobacteria bacterium GR16-43]
MPLDLSVPVRAAAPKDLEIRPKQAKAWLESLPLAQSIEAAKKIRVNLAGLSRAKIELDDRLAVLEAYRPISAVVLDELDAVYSKAPLPLGAKARECLGLAREIAAELANGYKIAILEKTGKLIAFGAKKQLPGLVFRAMEYAAEGMRASYKSYTPLPPGLWKEINALYLFAVQENIANEVGDAETKLTVTDLYLESLLLSLTDPYRLIQGEVDRTIELLRGNRSLATIGTTRPATSPAAHFLVPCDTDKPPKPLTSASDDPGGPNARLLDANPLVDRLRQRKVAIDSGNVSATMSRMISLDAMQLLVKLIALWGDPPKRAFRRDPMETSVAICAGLRTLSHFVGQQASIDVGTETQAIESGITIPLISVPDDEVSKGLQVNEWDVVNQSAGGLKVKRVGATNQSISVGEALGIKFLGKSRWTIGVVRWLTMLDDGGMEFGIQFLAPAARVVAVTPSITASGTVKIGLLLYESEGSEDADSLLAPPTTYADLREFEMEEDGAVRKVRATSLIEKTGRFELFHISPS